LHESVVQALLSLQVIVGCEHVPLEHKSVVHTLLSLQLIPQSPQLLVVVIDVSHPLEEVQSPHPELHELQLIGVCIQVVFEEQASVVHALLSVVHAVPAVRGL
jgi:hypothetical protein